MKRAVFVLFALFILMSTTAQPVKDMGTPGSLNNDLSFLDSILANKRIVMLGESSHGTNDPAFDRRMPTLYWGKEIQKMNLFKSYNAVILVNGVSAPVYLK